MLGIGIILIHFYMYAFSGSGIFPDNKRFDAMIFAMLTELFVEVIILMAYYVINEV